MERHSAGSDIPQIFSATSGNPPNSFLSSTMADQAEFAFIKTFVNTISTQPITYDDEYQQPPENSLKKIPVLTGVAVPEPPARKVEETAAGSSSSERFKGVIAVSCTNSAHIATLNLLIKSTKPPITYTLSGIHPTDTISAIKQHLSTTNATAPAPDTQRLLLKGKALADNKLLKEYPVKDGDTINLMVKPGVEWNPSGPAAEPPAVTLSTPAPKPAFGTSLSSSLLSGGSPAAASGHTGKRHQRIPSVVLSPSPSNEDDLDAQPRKDVLLTLDTTDLALGTGSTTKETLGAYHLTISSPGFWDKLIQFLRCVHIFCTVSIVIDGPPLKNGVHERIRRTDCIRRLSRREQRILECERHSKDTGSCRGYGNGWYMTERRKESLLSTALRSHRTLYIIKVCYCSGLVTIRD